MFLHVSGLCRMEEAMSKESDRQESRWHVSIVLLGTIMLVYVMSILLIQAAKTL